MSNFYDESSDLNSNDENLFFGKQNETVCKEISKWEDSEEEENKIRREYKLLNNYVWKNNPKKELKNFATSKIKIKLKKKVLKCNNNIKLVKSSDKTTVIVTAYNDIYVYENLNENKKYRAINLSYNITDFDFCANKIVFVSQKIGVIKEINVEDFKVNDIKKGTDKKYKKIKIEQKSTTYVIYLMSEKLEMLDGENYSLIHLINDNCIDFCLSNHLLVTLAKDGSLNVYCKETYKFMYKKVYKEKYFFTNITFCDEVFFVSQNKGVLCFDENFENRKDLFDFKVENVVENKSFYVFYGEGQNQIRIVKKKGFKILSSFPYSNMQFIGVKGICFVQNDLLFAHSSFLSRLEIK